MSFFKNIMVIFASILIYIIVTFTLKQNYIELVHISSDIHMSNFRALSF